MSPLKFGYTVESDKGAQLDPGKLLEVPDGRKTMLKTPVGEAWAIAGAPVRNRIIRALGIIIGGSGRGLATKFPGDANSSFGYEWQQTREYGDTAATRLQKIKTEEGVVVIKAVSYPAK